MTNISKIYMFTEGKVIYGPWLYTQLTLTLTACDCQQAGQCFLAHCHVISLLPFTTNVLKRVIHNFFLPFLICHLNPSNQTSLNLWSIKTIPVCEIIEIHKGLCPCCWQRAPKTLELSYMTRTLESSLVLILVLDPGSWHRAPETFVVSCVIRISFVVMRQLWRPPEWGLVMGKSQLEFWNFQPCPHYLEKGEGLKMELMTDHACVLRLPWNHRSMEFRGLPGWCTCGAAGRVPYLDSHCKLHASSHIPRPICLLHLHVHLYPLSCPLKNR